MRRKNPKNFRWDNNLNCLLPTFLFDEDTSKVKLKKRKVAGTNHQSVRRRKIGENFIGSPEQNVRRCNSYFISDFNSNAWQIPSSSAICWSDSENVYAACKSENVYADAKRELYSAHFNLPVLTGASKPICTGWRERIHVKCNICFYLHA